MMLNSRILASLSAGLLVFVTAISVPTFSSAEDEIGSSQDMNISPESCDFWEHAEFGGDRKKIRLGRALKYVGDDWNDRISSIACSNRCRIIAFEHRDFQGASREFAGGYASQYVGDSWNDRISSIRINCDGPSTASNNCGFGPATCDRGFVWREAIPQDRVCVDPTIRRTAMAENRDAAKNRAGAGASGPNTCKPGFVWREAFPGDVVCVSPGSRDQARIDNSRAGQRVACRP